MELTNLTVQSMGSGPNWYQLEYKTKHVMYEVLANVTQKQDIYINRLESVIKVACKRVFYIPEHNAKRDLKEMSFEGLEMQR